MPDVEPHRLAMLDQWNAMLNEIVADTVHHWAGECPKPPGVCIGGEAGDKVDDLEPVMAKILLEIAIVRLALADQSAKAAGAPPPAHWCQDCGVHHA